MQRIPAIGQLDDSIALIWLSVNYFFLHLLHETSEAYTNVFFISVPAGIDGLAVQWCACASGFGSLVSCFAIAERTAPWRFLYAVLHLRLLYYSDYHAVGCCFWSTLFWKFRYKNAKFLQIDRLQLLRVDLAAAAISIMFCRWESADFSRDFRKWIRILSDRINIIVIYNLC